ncbi:MAG TPA: hypothetical protein DFI00_12290, partial [Rhodospirillaceae bacterium]|nr:hypothetical protein [Rhodospirillaceae bacterium]
MPDLSADTTKSVSSTKSSAAPVTGSGPTTPRIAVIGAGITGMTTAFRLQQQGYDVTVIERQRYAG